MNIHLYQNKKRPKLIRMLLHIPVPWVFVMTYLFGLIPQFIFKVHIHPSGPELFIRIAGIILFVLGAVFATWSLVIFHKSRNTTTPGERSDKLIMTGPYRFSRNPMYISLILAYLGEAGILLQIFPLIFLPLTIAYLQYVVIPLEEEILREDFNRDFDIYSKSVNRWV